MDTGKKDIILDIKLVGDISGDFYISSYQRGYRWSEIEVERLLMDIYSNGTSKYCLQPIVVKKRNDKYEVVDGQQRLTTIFLIYQYMHNMHTESNGSLEIPKFTIEYETREKSADFLRNIDEDKQDENIDFYFMYKAYQTIQAWFEKKEKKSTITNIHKYFDENIEVIWYEVGDDEDAVSLFERLNIGKIPLTSSELIKAMFLGSFASDELKIAKQEEIALQWDLIEKELHNEGLWYFLANDNSVKYNTRIDLILDLIAKRPNDTKERYYTYFEFDKMKNNIELSQIWNKIQHTFLLLKDWYEDNELYHKIGYLIAINEPEYSLQKMFDMQNGKTKTELKSEIDRYIGDSIKINSNYADLSYENPTDYKKISRLLLLFNIISVYEIDEKTQRFPFIHFKKKSSNQSTWSLEHIHAQHSQGLQKQEQWYEWLKLHKKSIESIGSNEHIANEIEELLSRKKITKDDFEKIQRDVIIALSKDTDMEGVHSISNLALIDTGNNAALSNSTFDVKRNVIVDKDKKGEYIPFCTKMVFLKYYTPSEKNQIHFWGIEDRKAYVKQINQKLGKYLGDDNRINYEKAGE